MKVEEITTHSTTRREGAVTESRSSLASIFTLARWSLRQTWWQMLLAGLALLAAVMVACVVPLFSSIATTASLQEVFRGDPLRSDLALNASAQGLSTTTVNKIASRFDQLIRPPFGRYLESSQASLVIRLPSSDLSQQGSQQGAAFLTIYATSLPRLQPALQLMQGHWPASTPGTLEIMMNSATASALHLSIGESLTLSGVLTTNPLHMQLGPGDPALVLKARLAGTFEVQNQDAAPLFGENFQPVSNSLGATYTVLADAQALLAQADLWAAQGHADALFSTQPFQLTWYYQLNTSQLQTTQIDSLTARLNTVQQSVGLAPNDQPGGLNNLPISPYVLNSQFYNPLPQDSDLLSLLQQYTGRIALVRIPVLVLAIQVVALLFFFASILLNMLIDHQMSMNALLSSRGASSRQVFWSLVTQGLALCLFSLFAGPLLATLLVTITARQILPTYEQGVIALTFSSFWSTLALIAPSVLGTVLVSGILVCLILRRAIGSTILEVRRESSRVSKQPFWLRYYLDVLAALIALSSFAVSLYLASIAHTLDARTQDLIIAPLTLVAPIFLLLAFLLLFLRIFPVFLSLSAWFTRFARGVTGMLAIVQMARAPRAAMRMTMLLALAVSFAFFILVLDASQGQRAVDIAAYESGADFSGSLPETLQAQTLDAVTSKYAHVPGILSTTAGFTSDGSTSGFNENNTAIKLRAVDARNFASTAIWGEMDSTQPLSTLMHLLTRQAATVSPGELLPVIVDTSTESLLDVEVGDRFSLQLSTLNGLSLGCQVVAIVTHIPTINSNVSANATASPGGVLADFTTLQKVYQSQIQRFRGTQAARATTLPVNYIWLRSSSDDHSLASVRSALSSFQLGVSGLYDRREIIDELQHDPLSFTILLLLSIGGAVALTLALVGDLVASWLGVRSRRRNFVVLRALGATSRQIASVLFCEQILIYLGALVLSIVFGLVLAQLAVPDLIFTDLPATGGMSQLSSDSLYLLQQLIPVQVVIPLTLRLALLGLVLLCAITLLLMIRTVLQPSMAQELRLSED